MEHTVDNIETLRLVHPDITNVARAMNIIVRNKYPEVSQLLPFQNGWEMKMYSDDNWLISYTTDSPGGDTHITQFLEHEVESLLQHLSPFLEKNPSYSIPASNTNWHTDVGSDWFSDDCFTYIRSKQSPPDTETLWGDVAIQLSFYLDNFLLASLYRKQKEIISKLLPEPTTYNLNSILPCLWVLECEEQLIQGTAFMLEGVGLVSCEHVIGTATQAFLSTDPTKKYPVEVISKNEIIDLSILKIDIIAPPCLPKGSAETIEQQASIAIIGFPNYRLGDSGVIHNGQISGFRPVSAIRRLLVNVPIIAGSSGGPVLDNKGLVIGVAVTGADRMEHAPDTEHHGIVPIEALKFLS